MLIEQYYPVIGGAENQAKSLSKKLSELGVEVAVLTGKPPKVPSREIVEGIKVRRLFYFSNLKLWKIKPFLLMWLVFIYLIYQRKEYDIIHVHLASPLAFSATLAARLLKKRVLIKPGSSGENFDLLTLAKQMPLGKMMSRYLLKADKIIAINSSIESDLLAFGFKRDQILRIPNGVKMPIPTSPTPRSEIRERLKITPNAKVLVFVGSFTPIKNIPFLLHGWKGVFTSEPNALLILLGDGPLRSDLEKLSKELGIQNSVWMPGYVRNVGDYLTASNIFVITSKVEGISNALLEAMSYGLAAVATRVLGNVDVIKDGENGLLVDLDDTEGLTNAITSLLKDENLRLKLGKAARKTIEEEFSIERVAERYKKLYLELLGLI